MPKFNTDQIGGSDPVVPGLPDNGLSYAECEQLDDADSLDSVEPVVVDTDTEQVLCVEATIDDTRYYIGWNPEDEHWEEIMILGTDDDGVYVQSLSIFDDETGDPLLQFQPENATSHEDIYEYIRAYLEYTHEDPDSYALPHDAEHA